MKTNAVIRIILYSVAIIVLASLLLSFAAYDAFSFTSVSRSDSHSVESIEAPYINSSLNFPATIHNLEVEWAAGNITIIPVDTLTQISVTETISGNIDDAMVCKQSGQTLKIQYCKDSVKSPSFGIDVDISKDLEIRVPASWMCDSLEIDAAAAEVYICDLAIDEFDFDGASGSLILENCKLDKMDIDTASGDVEFSGILKRLDFDAASASFWGNFREAPKSITMNTMSGDLELVLPPDCGFTCEMDAMSGEFNSDFEIKTNNHRYTHGNGDCQIKISAMSGDVEILKGA